MRFEINVKKSYLAVFLVLIGLGFVIAVEPFGPVGHGSDQVNVDIGGTVKTLQEAFDDGDFKEGDITGVVTVDGILGGSDFGELTLSANTNFLQKRVGGACNAGSSIRHIKVDGTVTCQTDTHGSLDCHRLTETVFTGNAIAIGCDYGYLTGGGGFCDGPSIIRNGPTGSTSWDLWCDGAPGPGAYIRAVCCIIV